MRSQGPSERQQVGVVSTPQTTPISTEAPCEITEAPLAPLDSASESSIKPASRFTLMPGGVRRSVGALLAGAALLTASCTLPALAQETIPTDPNAPIPTRTVLADSLKSARTEVSPEQPVIRTGHFSDGPAPGMAVFQQQSRRLRARLNSGEISLRQWRTAHRQLVSGILTGTTDLPRDWRGRIDLDAVIYGAITGGDRAKTRGQKAVDRFTRELEARMQVTARDLAYFDSTPFIRHTDEHGMDLTRYDFKEIDPKTIGKMLKETFRQIPVGGAAFRSGVGRPV